MLDVAVATPFSSTAEILGDVRVAYVTDAKEARQRLKAMRKGSEWLAIDIETTPTKREAKRILDLGLAKAALTGTMRALRRIKATPPTELEALEDSRERIEVELKHALRAGLDPRRARIRLLQVYDGGDECLVIDVDRTRAGVLKLIDGANVIAHNMAFELSFLEQAGVALGEMHCTLQATRLALGERATGLADAAEEYLNLKLDKAPQTGDWSAPTLSREQVDYAAIDAVVAWRLAAKLLPRIDVQRSAYEIQMMAIPAVVRMEARGFKIDVGAHAQLVEALKQERPAVVAEYRDACISCGYAEIADRPPSTPAQKAELLETLLSSEELLLWKRTEKSGALSTKRSELMRAARYPPVLAMVRLSRTDKLMSSFGAKLALLTDTGTGRIHARYRVAGTASGRASCSQPNLQQIPRDPRFRALFIPELGNVLIVADYSSMELRAAAYISGDAAMTAVFEQGLDLHRATAAQITGNAPDDVTPEERRGAKAVNFGACYGMGAEGLVKSAWENYDLVLEIDEARVWLQAFEGAYPTFARWRRDHYQRCEDRGYIVIGKDAEALERGRTYPKSHVPHGESYYTRCCNLPIQGACADASMLALSLVDARLYEAGIDGGPVGWLHDEIVLEVKAEDADRAAEILRQSMIDAFAETFPGAPVIGLVDPHIGDNWGKAKG